MFNLAECKQAQGQQAGVAGTLEMAPAGAQLGRKGE